MPYIGKSTDGLGIRERFTYVASADDTSISGADANGKTLAFEDPEYVDVFLNGVRLKKGTDYNTNTANTIAGLAALAANDEIEVIVNDVFTLADMVSARSGGDFQDNIAIAKDSGVLSFGKDKEITLTHSADAGLILKHAATADDSFPNLLLQTGDTDIAVNDVLGSIQFQAPDEGTGTDAILVGAAIQAISEGDFSSSNNATKLSFQTGASEAAAEKMSLSSAGVLTVSSNIVSSGTITGGGLLTTGGSIVIPDDGNIGSASDTNAIAISSAGVVTISTNTDATNSTSGALIAHSAGIADDLYVGDGLFVTGAITGSGAVQGTNITATTAFLPDASDGAALGSASLEFSDLFLADGAVINFGDDQDINITHVADTGLTTNGTFQATTLTATTAFVPDASDGATLGSATLEFSDLFLADGGEVKFGADQDVLLRHDHNSGLIIDRTNTSDNSPTTLTLQTAETDIQADDVIGTINFQAPDEGTGTDAVLVAAGIDAVSEGDFSSSNNATKLVFKTAASETASSKMTLSSAGLLTVADDIVFKDGGTIGVTSAVDAMTVSSGGIVTFKDDILIKDGGTIGNASIADVMTLASTGIVTFKDDILIKDGGTIGSASDADAITIASNGQLTLTQTLIGTALDISGDIDVDGTTNLDIVDIDGAVDMASTLQVDGAITSSAGMTITTADNLAQLTLVSTDADAGIGPHQVYYRNSGSPADSDLLGEVDFRGRNDNSQDVDYVTLNAKIIDATDGTEDGQLIIQTMENGSIVSKVDFNSGSTTFNQDGANVDFIVEGDADANLFVVDAGEDAVRIKTTNHYAALTIENDDAGAQERALYAALTGTSGTSPLNIAMFSATDSNFTGSAVRIHLENPNSSQNLIQCTVTGSNTDVFTVDKDGGSFFKSNMGIRQAPNNSALSVTETGGNETIANFTNNAGSNPFGIAVDFSDGAPDNNNSYFFSAEDSANTPRIIIYSDGDVYNHDGTYAQFSDERIKDNITDANAQWNDIKAMRFVNYQRKDDILQYGEDKAKVQLGLIGQELEKVSPNLVRQVEPNASDIRHSSELGTLYTSDDAETKDGNDAVLYTKDDIEVELGQAKVGDVKTEATHSKKVGDIKETKDKVKGVAYSVLYMKAVKALQEAMTRIETLESSNTALAARIKALEDA